MKLHIKSLVLFCALTGVLTSCDMDVVPPAEISAEISGRRKRMPGML